jgi:hypothetical protein
MSYVDKRTYVHDCGARKEDPIQIVKWMRRNFGERGHGWDFGYSESGRKIWLELRDDKIIMMYEMWYGDDGRQ